MSDDAPPASTFPAPDLAAWRRAVDTIAGSGAGPDALVHHTYDRIAIEPLYLRDGGALPPAPPGMPPFVRGTMPAASTVGGWDVRGLVSHVDPTMANRQIHEELQGGASSIHLVFDDAIAAGGNPSEGVLAHDLDDMAALLDGVDLGSVPLAIDAGARGFDVAALLVALARDRVTPPAAWRMAFDLDPLGAAAGGASLELDAAVVRSAEITAVLVGQGHVGTVLRADGRPYHGGGGSSAQELAGVMATAVAYLRSLEAHGLEPRVAAARIAFRLAVDADVFTGIAKLRAARKLWHRITQACGASAAGSVLDAITGIRCYAGRTIEANVLRGTAACFAAAAGGAAAVTILPFDTVLGPASATARRIARNTQLICMHESYLHRIADPAGGSFHLEALTTDLAREAWSLFQMIEGGGGMAAMLRRGSIQDWIAETARARAAAAATGADLVTGVSAFPDLAERDHPRSAAAGVPDLTARARTKLADAVETGALAWTDAIEAAASGRALRSGRHAEAVTAIPRFRSSTGFERFRDLGDAWFARTGHRPAVSARLLGGRDRALIQRDEAAAFLASGGIALVEEPPETNATQRRIVLICDGGAESSDIADATADARADGAVEVWGIGDVGPFDRLVADGVDRLALFEEVYRLTGHGGEAP